MFSIYQRCLGATALVALTASSASANIWSDLGTAERAPVATSAELGQIDTGSHVPAILRARQLRVDLPALSATLDRAPLRKTYSRELSGTVLDLPLPNGETASFSITNAPVMGGALSNGTGAIRTFRAVDVNNPANTGRLDLTPQGFHAMFDYGTETVFIDPMAGGGYQSYFKSDYTSAFSGTSRPEFSCGTAGHNTTRASRDGNGLMTPLPRANRATAARAIDFGTELKTFRIAIAATGEYTTFHGGTAAEGQAAIVTAMNRINQVFERDMAVTMELVPTNVEAVFTDGTTDPFTDDDPEALIEEVSAVLNDKIGVDNYDIGHVFSTRGGGLAALGSICGNFKAEGVTGIRRPINDAFLIDFVAHELGHQFGALHTFNGTEGGCGGGNRFPTAAYEVGSASTIMGYAQLCGSEDLQIGSDEYFHIHSIIEMRDVLGDAARGGSCGVISALGNAAPVVTAGADGVIPVSTPFSLTGAATDADGDTLSYIWEQYDLGRPTTSRASQTGAVTGPLFRSFVPLAEPTRTFPKISDIVGNTTTYGEILPTIERELNFRLTARDGNGGVTAGTRKLDVVAAAGPFIVADPADTTWAGGENQTITWDVANTTAAPINCAAVNIDLSTDNGLTFPTSLATGAANDGSARVTVPAGDTTTARVRVSCATQPFFAINPNSFSVSGTAPPATANTAPVATADTFTVAAAPVDVELDVLGNDSDADGDTLTLTGTSGFNNGGSARIAGRQLLYTAAADFEGVERFDYSVSDGEGGTASGTVTVTVEAAPNTDPNAVNDVFTLAQDSSATDLDVLANDSDADADTLSLVEVSTPNNGGTVSIASGLARYTPAAGFSGAETFTYTIDDGNGGRDTATVSMTITAPPPVVVTPPVTPTSSGGGGSFGLLLLGLLGLRRRFGANTEDAGELA